MKNIQVLQPIIRHGTAAAREASSRIDSYQPSIIMAAKKTTKKAAPAKKAAKKAVKKVAKKAAKKAANKKASPKASFEKIAAEAYCIYRDRIAKGLPGNPETDWLAAEKKLKA